MLEYQIDIALRGMAVVLSFLPRPLNGEGTELFECAEQSLFSYVPWNAAEEHFGGVHGIAVATGGEHAGPGADDRIVSVVLSVVLAGAVG